MKKGLLVIFVVLFAVSVTCTAFGATFTYYNSSLFSQSGAKVSNNSGTDDPGADVDWSTTEVNSNQTAMIPDKNVEASGDGHGSAKTFENTLSIHVDGNVSGMSEDVNGHMEAYGGASMVQPGVTAGIFFQITPEAGESYGDLVQIDFNWMGELSTSDGIRGHLSGGWGGDAIAITLNDYPSSDPLENVAWSHERIDRSDGDGFYDGEDGFFMAVIGDIVGIHMDSAVHLEWDGVGYEMWAWASQGLTMEVNAVPIPGAVWLLGSGLFGLVAVRKRRNNMS